MTAHAPPYEAIVFDLDGVLLDTTENMRYAFTEVWRTSGLPSPAPFERFLEHMGAPLKVILEHFGLPPEYTTVYERASSERPDLIARCASAREVLESARFQGTPVAVATGKRQERAVEALRLGGLDDLVDEVVGSDLVQRPKPAPEILHLALSRLPGPTVAPSSALFVGDSVLDMRCGRSAGVPTAAVNWGQTALEVLLTEKPDFYVTDPAELISLMTHPPKKETTLG